MNSSRYLACIVALVASGFFQEASSQGRVPAKRPATATPERDAAMRSQKIAELDAWLRRLVGNFSFEGSFTSGDFYDTPCRAMKRANPTIVCTDPPQNMQREPVKGLWRCSGVGDGPGVRCSIHVEEGRPWSVVWDPVVILLGVDASQLSIAYLHVDNQGVADTALGTLGGGTVVFPLLCPKVREILEVRDCRKTMRVTASPGNGSVRLWVDLDRQAYRTRAFVMNSPLYLDLQLRRTGER